MGEWVGGGGVSAGPLRYPAAGDIHRSVCLCHNENPGEGYLYTGISSHLRSSRRSPNLLQLSQDYEQWRTLRPPEAEVQLRNVRLLLAGLRLSRSRRQLGYFRAAGFF